MTYQQCLEWLFSRLPMYQRTGQVAYKEDIGNIVLACHKLGNPHINFKSIHVAGTNGKGSTSHMLASVLQEAGYKTGLYTSPHLKDFRERIRIDGEMISKNEVVDFVKKNKDWFIEIKMSFFEMTVALAFHHFAKKKVDIAIIEVGLGGRLDSTNIIKPEVSIITNIGKDHEELLGNTIEKIAVEKAGIIKKNTPVVIGKKQKETIATFEKIANKKHAKLYYSEDCTYETDLKGIYQKYNKKTAVTTLKLLAKKGWSISEKHIENGLLNVQKNTSFIGRWMIINEEPLTICDTGHNEDGIKVIVEQIKGTNYQNLHIVFGVVNDKSLKNILSLLPKEGNYYFCQANIQRALDADTLLNQAKKHKLKGKAYSSVEVAYNMAKSNAKNNDFIFIGGSTFVVAEIL